MLTDAEIKRGRILDAISNEEFIALWPKYRQMTPNELNAIEPFYVISAMRRLYNFVKDE